jgi:uncharacterized protein YeaO (DUF488 family)
LNDNISKLEKNNQGNKKELEEKKKEYQKELKAAKKETIENIQKELEKNELKITELDDNRN